MAEIKQELFTLSEQATLFKASIGEEMLVENIVNSKTKVIDVKANIFNNKQIRSSTSNIRSEKVIPKQDNSNIDGQIKNIYSHKGPNEPETPSGDDGDGGEIGAL